MSPAAERATDGDQRHQTDRERLSRVTQTEREFAYEACRRAGLQAGQRAIDIGCGSGSTLAVLADLVGPTGVVIGLDVNADALAEARRFLNQQGMSRVRLVQGDINTLRPEAVCPPGPFDLAFCRFVLVQQADPAATLRVIAALLRPGGRIVAQDILDDPWHPSYHPPVPAVERFWRLSLEELRRTGVATDTARRYPALIAAAGARLLSQRGHFSLPDPNDHLPLVESALLTMRRTWIEAGLTTDTEIDQLLEQLCQAEATLGRFCTGPLIIEAIAEVP